MESITIKKIKRKLKQFRIFADKNIYYYKGIDEQDAKIRFEYDKGVTGILRIEEVRV